MVRPGKTDAGGLVSNAGEDSGISFSRRSTASHYREERKFDDSNRKWINA